MDFFQIRTREPKRDSKVDLEIFPDFEVGRSKDLMVRGRSFYAVWDDKVNLWSTDEYDVQRLVDEALREFTEAEQAKGFTCSTKYLRSFGSNGWSQFRKFLNNVSDNSHQLDTKLTFADTKVRKSDYVSRRLPYSLVAGDHSAWDELVSTLYSPEEQAKIEWAIGAVISGDSKKIQKFLVFYGPGGTGKSTILNVIQKLFDGYAATFEAKALVSNNNAFGMEAFRTFPLVAIQHDGDLSRIADNSRLNSIVSHEEVTINEKYKPSYTGRMSALLMMGTNLPVKITDAKSGLIRRLIDVQPSGNKIPTNRYNTLVSKIDFELGAIAQYCLDVYRAMGKNYYNSYRPLEMMFQTDIFFNFIEDVWDIFKAQDGATLKQAYALYKKYCEESTIDDPLPQYKFRSELKNYFDEFIERGRVNGEPVRSYFSGFRPQPPTETKEDAPFSLVIEYSKSVLDLMLSEEPAQYSKADGNPSKYWTDEERVNEEGELFTPKISQVVSTTLEDLDTSRLHYVKLPQGHIVIDFDLTDDAGVKSLERNLEAASRWPATYAELSKSGSGIHLHYVYEGDTSMLSPKYDDGIEVKVYTGNASLRRKLTKCNNIPVAIINSGLPIKETKMLSANTIQSEKGLRELVGRNLRKEIHPGTKPSIDFIKHILDQAYESGLPYDLTDMRPKIIAFANNSTNKAMECFKVVKLIKFKGQDVAEVVPAETDVPVTDKRIVFFDVEVYPNLFAVCYKYAGSPDVVKLLNPSPQDVEALFKLLLVGFNNRKYDNHILYARYLGYDNQQLYELSKKIISGIKSAMFGPAYSLSYADIYDFSSVKMSLKKFQIKLKLRHLELDLPWDQPVPEEKWLDVLEYCANDVKSTESVFNDRKQDFVGRQILAALSGLTVNDTTPKHTAQIVFGGAKNPQKDFVYTDLSIEFPGYQYDFGTSYYRGEKTGEGGYVYAEPKLYSNVALLDIASMHPTTIEILNLFGPYTERFTALKNARLAVKRRDYERARQLLDGKLLPYLDDETQASALDEALKLSINMVYGLTSAKFDNPFRDPRNKDNIVAKRGALFMIDLKHHMWELGHDVIHIKTDSIKIPNATPEIIEEVIAFGKRHGGYTFEHEATYDKFCLVNESTYIARKKVDLNEDSEENLEEDLVDVWTAVGAQFQHPYVFKTLFSGEPITFEDLCETKQVSKGALYLDFKQRVSAVQTDDMHFIGRTGLFVPVTKESGGAILYRVMDGKNFAAAGTKDYYFLEAAMVETLSDKVIDMSYFERLVNEARETIAKFGSLEELLIG